MTKLKATTQVKTLNPTKKIRKQGNHSKKKTKGPLLKKL